ncbi:hypothetical protein [uncultured Shimia sp.]|uniref:hypothetical protein n=1 Tax=uncultured Shimia sp. TaxID=573152 RepID=UPI0025D2DA97|nr:hypothetical protein [uncultured Shimia sp.]
MKCRVPINLIVLLFAALSFATFSTAHVTRVIAEPLAEVAGLFGAGDICGDMGSDAGQECPSCVVASTALFAQSHHLSRAAFFHKEKFQWLSQAWSGRVSNAVYLARAPPSFS